MAKEFGHKQITFLNDLLGLANTTCHWNTGLMVADNGPCDAQGEFSPFQLQLPFTILTMFVEYTVFLSNLMLL